MPTTPTVDYPQEETAEEENFSPEDGADTAEGANQFLQNQNQPQEQPQEKKQSGGDSTLDKAKNARDAAKDAKGLADKFGGGAKAAGEGAQAAGQGAGGAGAAGAGGSAAGAAGGTAAGSAGGAAAGTAAGTAAGAGAGAAAGAGGGAAAGAAAGVAGGPLAPITVPAGAVLGAAAAKTVQSKKGRKVIIGLLLTGCGCFFSILLLPAIVIGMFLLPGLVGANVPVTEGAPPPGGPPGGGGDPGSKVLLITKTASRNHIPLNEVNASVTYTIRVRNTSPNDATDVKVTDAFFSTPDGSLALDVTGYQPEYTIGPLAAGAEDVKTFTVDVPHTDFSPGWLLTNKVSVSGLISGVSEISSSSATVAIGDSPNCYTFAGTWSETEKAQMLEAINVLIQSPSFATLVCAGGSVNLSRTVDGTYYGVTNGANGITIHGPNTGSLGLRLYILAHESGHVVGNMNPSLMNDFVASGVFEAEGLVPTYAKELGLPSTNCSTSQVNIPYACYDESFAEMVSDYVIYKFFSFLSRAWSGYPGGVWFNHGSGSWDSFNTDWPQHYNFASSRIFGGFVY